MCEVTLGGEGGSTREMWWFPQHLGLFSSPEGCHGAEQVQLVQQSGCDFNYKWRRLHLTPVTCQIGCFCPSVVKCQIRSLHLGTLSKQLDICTKSTDPTALKRSPILTLALVFTITLLNAEVAAGQCQWNHLPFTLTPAPCTLHSPLLVTLHQLENLEAAKTVWLAIICPNFYLLLSLTLLYWALLGLTRPCFAFV